MQRRRLGIELRRLREQAGLTIEDVAATLECSHSKVSRIENGQVSATPRDVRDMLDIYKVDREQRDALIQVAREARQKGWWQAYSDAPVVPLVGLETAATQIRQYAATGIPGLLQTTDYARAVIRAARPDLNPQQVDRWIELRMARQKLLIREEPPALLMVLEECGLHRPVGGPSTAREQLRHLAQAAALPAVTLRVLPRTLGEHAGLSGTFTIFEFSDPDDPDVVYLEQATSDIYLESVDEVKQYAAAFDSLWAAALAPRESIGLLASMADGLR
jgi:transcriptional regulator with XRE-family HTH domain